MTSSNENGPAWANLFPTSPYGELVGALLGKRHTARQITEDARMALSALGEDGENVERRPYVLDKPSDATLSIGDGYEQVDLAPSPAFNYGIRKVILRTPHGSEDGLRFTDTFVEVRRDAGAAEFYLANNDMLTRYERPEDVVDSFEDEQVAATAVMADRFSVREGAAVPGGLSPVELRLVLKEARILTLDPLAD